MRTLVVLAVATTMFGATTEIACKGSGDRTGTAGSGVVASAMAAERGDDVFRKSTRSADSSPYVVGEWKFVPAGDGGTPSVDTEFRFINPTDETLTLEYAFFELDGTTFCGCDRDDFPPNHTTVYTMKDEATSPAPIDHPTMPLLFNCRGTAGALKSIVFKHQGQTIFLDEGLQVGFQTHVFGGIVEGDNSFLTGNVMTEAPLQGIAIEDSTRDEIRSIHQQCIGINGPL